MRGVKPPRYPSLWEACVNSIVFQQLSLGAASAIMHRLIVALGHPVEADRLPVPLYVFPANDTGVASNIALLAGSAPFDTQSVLNALGPQCGMLYFCLLLAHLEARDEIGRPSFERPQPRAQLGIQGL